MTDKRKKSLDIFQLQIFNKMIREILEVSNVKRVNRKTYYYKRDKKSFFKESKQIIKKSKREGIPINDWLIFQRYMKYKEFKEIFN